MWNGRPLEVDGRGSVWSSSVHGMMTPIGKMVALTAR